MDTITVTPTGSTSTGGLVYAGYVSSIDASAGQYILSVSDANSCPSTATITITDPAGMPFFFPLVILIFFILALSVSVTQNGNDLSASVNGGSAPYTYPFINNSDNKIYIF